MDATGHASVKGSDWLEKQLIQRIDRAFFRSAYDARHILENLAEKTTLVVARCV